MCGCLLLIQITLLIDDSSTVNNCYHYTHTNKRTHTHMHAHSNANLEKFVNLGEVDTLLCIQLVDIAVAPVHQIQTKAHYLDKIHRRHLHIFSHTQGTPL